jgi:hypothetical protein
VQACDPLVRDGRRRIVGTGAKKKYNLSGHLIYAMKVEEILSFDEYWNDPRFRYKRPVLNGSLKQIHGDNIYHREQGKWMQSDSHHSFEDGRANATNIDTDTRADRVLISTKFVYFGSAAIAIPAHLQDVGSDHEDVCCTGRSHRRRSHNAAAAFEGWLNERNTWGVQGMPLEFSAYQRRKRQQATSRGSRGRAGVADHRQTREVPATGG